MPGDIRSFFAPKGGATPAKPAPVKDTTENGKRKTIQDSDDEEEKKPAKPSTSATKPKTKPKDAISGVEMSASTYFSSKPTSSTPSKEKASPSTTTMATTIRRKPEPRAAKATPAIKLPEDEESFLDDDPDGGDDIHAADMKSRSKRRNDDYEEASDDSEDDVKPKTKRVATRSGKVGVVELTPVAPSSNAKKRKSLAADSDDDQDKQYEEQEEPKKKRKTPATTRAPRQAAPKAIPNEAPEIQDILDSIPTVRPPTPPPKDPKAPKFDWRKAKGGGNAAAPPPAGGSVELPVGEEECLAGLSFVFTGILQTIGRDEAQELVKRYGGQVKGQPSSKTSYVVLGEDAGPSKLAKIESFGIKTINEEGLFELIRKLPAYGGSGKGAEKAMEKRKAEEEKIRRQAEEMDREEKERLLAAEKAAQKAAASRGLSTSSSSPSGKLASSTSGSQNRAKAPITPALPTQLWTSKYAPTQLSHICGNKAQVERIQTWLRNWPNNKKYDFQKRGADGMGTHRAIIISGPPGIGKTTSAHLAANLEGYDVLESNASDTRSKKLVEGGIGDVINNTSLLGFFAGDGKSVDAGRKKIVLVMDEVDGMSSGDRGGVGALAKLCKKTEVPLILICNERKLPKMKPFDFVAFDVKFQRPTIDQIRSRIMTICHREGLKMPPPVVDALIEGSGRDIRQIINMISTAKLDQSSMDFQKGKEMSKAWEKHVILKPWDICQKLLAGGLFAPSSTATLNDKIELYFNDHEFSYLMIQENYLRTKPMALNQERYGSKREENLKALELFEQAAESISDGDLVDRMIHGPQQHWSLMPTHAIFSSVRPASFVAGQLMGSNFTSWLGNNSKQAKLARYVREIQAHMRLRSSADHNEIRQQYLPVLWTHIVDRLAREGKEAVPSIIELMDSYFITRDDVDAMMELGVGPQAEDTVQIATQTKATFTRTYNGMAHPVPFLKASNVMVTSKKADRDVPDLEEAIQEEDDAAAADDDDSNNKGTGDDVLDLKNDKMIKAAKPKGAAAAKKKKAATAADGDKPKAAPRSRAKAKK